MKKFLKVFLVLSLLSVNVVSAKSSITIKDLESNGIQIFPSTDSSSYKIYYQWVKFEEEDMKKKKELEEQLHQIEEQHKDARILQAEIEENEQNLKDAENRLKQLEEDKQITMAAYDQSIKTATDGLEQTTEDMNRMIECFNDSECTTPLYSSLEEIEQYYSTIIAEYNADISLYTNQKLTAESDYNTKIDYVEVEIIQYQEIAKQKDSNLALIEELENTGKKIQNEIIDLTKYDDSKWLETSNLIIPKPTSETEENYVLWVKLSTAEGEIIYASTNSKSLIKKSSTISNKQENSKEENVKNPETSDYVLKLGVVGILSLGTIILSKKKLKAIKNIQ